MVKIITVPNPILRKISQPIRKLDKKTLKIIRDLEETLYNATSPIGVGLSAIQIAKPIRVFSACLTAGGERPSEKQKPIIKTYINPEIVKTSKQKTLGEDLQTANSKQKTKKRKPILEGCLSIPNVWGPVWRYRWIELKYFTLDPARFTLREHSKRFSNFEARVILHELDHLNGILFTDHSLRDNLPLYEYQEEKLVKISLRH